jgi:hypothetical protein|tara:strand:+ start:38 stop:403 length:366 start_codon:yes stop_codon:yes gene_type:complete
MLHYHFNKKLISTEELLKELSITISNLNFWKTELRKKGYEAYKNLGGDISYESWVKNNDPCWDMGLRVIGKRAFYDPIIFLNWIFQNKIKNKPKDLMERAENKKLIAFIKRNASAESVELI